MTRTLRKYQSEAVKAIHKSWDGGVTRTGIVMATGLGKTSVIGKLATDEARAGGRVLCLAHRAELLDQIGATCKEFASDIPVGRVQAAQNQTRRPITVAMAQTLASANRRARMQRPTLTIVDECFPAGTLVGGVPIESIRTGDFVESWDELANCPVRRKVTATMRSRPSALVRVQTDQGDIVCTPGHRFLTTGGWASAIDLPHGAQVVSFTHGNASLFHMLDGVRDDASPEVEPGQDRTGLLFSGLRGRGARQGDRGTLVDSIVLPVHGVRYGDQSPDQEPEGDLVAQRADVLLGLVPGHLGSPRRGTAAGAGEPRTSLGADASQEPDARPSGARQDGRHVAQGRPPTTQKGRQRNGYADRAAGARGVSWLADRGHLHDPHGRSAVALQAGHRAPDDEGLRGGRRRLARLDQPPRGRREAGRAAALARVVGVQVLEPGSDGTYGGVCPRGVVYNLEVEGTHTYRVGAAGLVAHNCHHAASPSYMEILSWAGSFDHTRTLGVTATMVRGDKRGLGDVWQEVCFSRDIKFGIDNGYLIEPRGRAVVTDHLDLNGAKVSRGDYQDNELGEMVEQDVDQIVRAWLQHAPDRLTVAFVPTVASAQALAAEFRDAGVVVGEVYGTTSRTDRSATYKHLAAGEIRVLVNVMVATEGFDCPPVSCILMARPTRLPGLYTQIVGRGLRPSSGKVDCLVLDVVGASRRQRLVTLIDLHETATYDTEELDALPCEDCGAAPCECLPGDGAAPGDGRVRLIGPAEYDDVEMFAHSALNWLFTHGGKRFLPAGDRMALLWPEGDEYLPGHCTVKGYTEGRFVGRDGVWLSGPLPLGQARELAESWAMAFEPTVAARGAGWRKRGAAPSAAQVAFAGRLGIPEAETMNRPRLSDEISIALASPVIDR